MTTQVQSPNYYAGLPASWNAQTYINQNLTGNAPDTSISGDLTQSGLIAESFAYNLGTTPVLMSTATSAGSVLGTQITLPVESTVTNLWYDIAVAGGTLTANDCWALLFNSSGTLIGQSADQHTIWTTAGLGGSAAGGTALTASATGSLSNLPAGNYYGALVYTGTTAPTVSCLAVGSAELANINTSVANANFRAAVLATGVTTTPASVTLTSATLSKYRLWMGVN